MKNLYFNTSHWVEMRRKVSHRSFASQLLLCFLLFPVAEANARILYVGPNETYDNIKWALGKTMIRENEVMLNGDYGILVRAPATINGNTVNENLVYGIWLDSSSTGSLVGWNEIQSNHVGLYLEEGVSDVSVTWNHITENDIGISARGGAKLRSNTVGWNALSGISVFNKEIDLDNLLSGDSGMNAFLENGNWNLRNMTPDTIFTCYNFWGLTDPDSIDARIRDDEEDSQYGPVIFEPCLGDFNVGVERAPVITGSEDLIQNMEVFPNPFADEVYIGFHLLKAQHVTLRVIDSSGRIIRILIREQYCEAGRHVIRWDGLSENKHPVQPGIYFF